MKALSIVLCLFGSVFCLSIDRATKEEWESYKAKFGKSYNTNAEDNFRLTSYLANKVRVIEHNKEFEAGTSTFTMGINKFSDMTEEEFASNKSGLRRPENEAKGRIYQLNGQVPDAVDWRASGCVTPVKDQKHCGACWAFAATGALEGQNFFQTRILTSLSEQNLVDCDRLNFGCLGGWINNAFLYVRNNGGIDTESSYPYVAVERPCAFNPDNIGATSTGHVDISYGDEIALQDAVANVGPIAIGFDASHYDFQSYSSGIYRNTYCSSDNLDHAALIVGYGTDENGEDYWLIKNQWGIGWGIDGYFYLARNENNMCGVASTASYPTV